MQSDDDLTEGLVREGSEALRQGRTAEARRALERLTATGPSKEQAWLLLAEACRVDGDEVGEERALNHLLEAYPHSLLGQIMKGDCRAQAGDHQLAIYFYRAALRVGEGETLPDREAAELRRAAGKLAELEKRAHDDRETRLRSRGVPPERWSPRFRHSLELAAGKKKAYRQEPTAFDFPGLPNVQFYDTAQFSWVPALEAESGAIRGELDRLLQAGTDTFQAYIQTDVGGLPLEGNRPLLDSRNWSMLALCENGWLVPEVIERCPRTWQAVLQAPVPRVAGWGPTIVFSMLRGGAHIARHNGMYNSRLICHLPLIVPPGCRFRVGNEVREWEPGKLLIFDDTIEHEAWNDSADDRVILIFDIWRPELSEQERHELTALFSD